MCRLRRFVGAGARHAHSDMLTAAEVPHAWRTLCMHSREPMKQGRTSFLHGFVWTGISTALSAALGLGSGVASARVLGPDGRGELATVFMYMSIATLIGILGLDQATAYLTGKRPEEEKGIVRAGMVLAFVLSTIQAALLITCGRMLLPADRLHLARAVLLVAPALIPMCICQVFSAADQGAFRFRRRAAFFLAQPGTYFVAAVAIWYSGSPVVLWFVVAFLGGHTLTLLLRVLHRASTLCGGLPSTHHMATLLLLGLRLHAPQLAWIAILKLDMVVGVYCLPTGELGLYVVAMSIALTQKLVLEAFASVSFAKLSRERSPDRADAMLLRHFRVAQVLHTLVLLALLVMSGFLLRIGFGAAFAAAAWPTYFLLVSWSLLSLSALLDRGLRALGHIVPGILAFVLAAAVLVLVGFALVPRYGVEGLAAVHLLASLCALTTLVSALICLRRVPAAELLGLRIQTFRDMLDAARTIFR